MEKRDKKIENSYLKSNMILNINNYIIDEQLIEDFCYQIPDKSLYINYIYELIVISFSNKSYNEIMEEEIQVKDFLYNILMKIKELSSIDINVEEYSNFWFSLLSFMISKDINNKLNILSDLKYIIDDDKIDLYFKMIYISEYLEFILKRSPIDYKLMNYLTNILKTQMSEYRLLKENKL